MSFTRNLIFSITLTTSAAFGFGKDDDNFSWDDFTYNSPEEKAFWDKVPDWTDKYITFWEDEWYDSNGSKVDENSSNLYSGYSKAIIHDSDIFVNLTWEYSITDDVAGYLRTITYFENGRFLKQSCWDVNGTKLFSESRDNGTDNIFVINNWYQNGVMANHIVKDIEKPNLISFSSWLPNGEKCPETNFNNGSGTVLYYDADGQKALEENHKEGMLVLLTEWFENGQKYFEVNYKEGKRDGLRTKWFENGQKKEEENYKEGKQDGPSTYWYKNGQKKSEVNFKEGKQDGPSTYWHENGQKKSEVNYKDGERDGLLTRWHENGQKEEERNYKDGKLDGISYDWQEDGNLKSTTKYKDETRTVTHYWVSTGKKKQEDTYKNNKRDGLLTKWFENGQKETEVNYKNGKRLGVFKEWDENGTLIRTGRYNDRPPPIPNWSTPNLRRILTQPPPPRRR